MKKSRLLEIIREEISYALNENYNNSTEEGQLNEIPFIDSPIDITLKNPQKEPNPGNIEDNAYDYMKLFGISTEEQYPFRTTSTVLQGINIITNLFNIFYL